MKWSGVDGEGKEMEMLTKEGMKRKMKREMAMAIGLKIIPQLEEGSSLIWW